MPKRLNGIWTEALEPGYTGHPIGSPYKLLTIRGAWPDCPTKYAEMYREAPGSLDYNSYKARAQKAARLLFDEVTVIPLCEQIYPERGEYRIPNTKVIFI